ncbi:hypothetical protein PR202_gb24204 [Eleusine coracana subsp. coracana]|uniref:Exocyst subunit Exo70 family protein n=1 Tax=Eleusine coracana subsp. coracana TaxID=191504 RepID=A0AAV5FLE4_ELECO|nr:hypothetical protein PR202_gb24204 [Eleusine coracana subsp. coracana]
MQRRLAEELRALRFDKKATLYSPGGAGYSTSIQRVVTGSVAATSACLVFPSSGSWSSSCTSLSSTGSAVVTPSSGPESYKQLRMEAFRDLSEIASHMVSDGYTGELITEFSRHQSSSGGDAILRTWFSELGVDWVLGVGERSLHREPWSAVEDKIKQWVIAFTVMAEALRLTRSTLSSDDGSDGGVPPLSTDKINGVSKSAPPGAAQTSSTMLSAAVSPGSSDMDTESSDPARHRGVDIATVKETIIAYSVAKTGRFLGFGQEEPAEPQNQFVIFAEASLMKMLHFTRVIAALKRSPEKILRMIDLYSLVSDASPGLLALLSGESKRLVSDEIESVLQTMSEAVRQILQSLTELIRADDSWRTMPGNGDIHPVSQYMLNS